MIFWTLEFRFYLFPWDRRHLLPKTVSPKSSVIYNTQSALTAVGARSQPSERDYNSPSEFTAVRTSVGTISRWWKSRLWTSQKIHGPKWQSWYFWEHFLVPEHRPPIWVGFTFRSYRWGCRQGHESANISIDLWHFPSLGHHQGHENVNISLEVWHLWL